MSKLQSISWTKRVLELPNIISFVAILGVSVIVAIYVLPTQHSTASKTNSISSTKEVLQVSDVISFVALTVSIISAIRTLPIQHNQEIRAKQEELRQILANILAIEKEYQETVFSIEDARKQFAASSILGIKRALYIEAAEVLANQIPNLLTVSEYIILATERFRDANYKLAEEYLHKAVKVSKMSTINTSVLQQNQALRSLALFYSQEQPLRSYEKGKKYFTEAVTLLESGSDPNSYYALGQTYEIWGLTNLYNRFTQEANVQIENAKRYYSKLPPPQSPYEPMPQQLIDNLNKKLETINNNLSQN